MKKFGIDFLNEKIPIVVTTLAGFEEILANEMMSLGYQDIDLSNRAVLLSVSINDIMRINYLSRLAVKVAIPFAKFEARTESEIYDYVFNMPWELWIDPSQTLAIEATVWSQYFKHSKFISLKVKDAIVDRIRNHKGIRPGVELQNPNFALMLTIRENEVQISLNSSGDSLHKRGYRRHVGEASLSEVLAAGIVAFTGWDGEVDFIDPMCGSGTLLIEAAYRYYNVPSQWRRKEFGFERWGIIDTNDWHQIKISNQPNFERAPVGIYGFDILNKAINTASENIFEARIGGLVNLQAMDFLNSEYLKPSVVVMNPPYDDRIKVDDIAALYQEIGNTLKHHWKGSNAWIFTGNELGIKSIGLKPGKKIRLKNGPLDCKLQSFALF